MDNAGCQPEDAVQDHFNNIELTFLPPNTTSKLQPLDLGAIQNFNVIYHTLFLRFVLSQTDACIKTSEVPKSLSILHSIRWVAKVWDAVSPETIRRWFKRAEMVDVSFSVHPRQHEHNPFLDIDLNTPEIENLKVSWVRSNRKEEFAPVQGSLMVKMTLPCALKLMMTAGTNSFLKALTLKSKRVMLQRLSLFPLQ